MGLESLGIGKDVHVAAPKASVAFDFPLPRLARVQSAAATIFLTPGAQLSGETVFSFYYNSKLIATRTAKDLRQNKSLVLPLPVDGIPRNGAQLQIKSGMFITEDQCRDYHSGGLFFTVHKNTSLNLTYNLPPVRTVPDFFDSFQQAVIVVVPDGATLEELTSGAWVYGLMKKNYPQLNVQLVRAAELSKLPPVPRIWVGIESRLPGYFRNAAPGITLVDPNTLLISAADAPNLKIFAKQLPAMLTLSVNPTNGKRITISPIETPSGKATEAVSFGNENIMEGIFSIPVEFQIYPALLEKIPERMGLHLEGFYTVSAESARPVRMDVFLNNQLVHSSVLDQTGQFKRDMPLQDNAELRSLNKLKVQFNYPENAKQCKVKGKVQTAQILPTSFMWAAGQYQPDRYEWANIGLYLGHQGKVLIDESMNQDTLKLAGEIAYFLNRQLPPEEAAFPDYLSLKKQMEVPEASYVVVAGLIGNIPLAIQEKLPISIGGDFSVHRKDTQNLLFEYQSTLGAAVGSVGKTKGGPLIMFATNLDGGLLTEVLRHIGRAGQYETMTGNVLIYQQSSPLYSFDVREKSVKSVKQVSKGWTLELWEDKNIWIVIASGIAIVLLLILFAYRKMFPRRRSRRAVGQGDSSKPVLFK